MQTIDQRLDGYSDFLAPLREHCRRNLKHPSLLGPDGVINIGHRPWVAELNYLLVLYPGMDDDSLFKYASAFGIEIPAIYSAFLREINGAFCFGMSLCGVPQSMMGDPPLLDRTVLQCHDLATSATDWIREYRVASSFFHFGGRHLSYTENVGYFIEAGEVIHCIRKNGKSIARWHSFSAFLADELQTSAALEEELEPSKWDA
jgi:hypothetical protein